jgi:hypothetical protein
VAGVDKEARWAVEAIVRETLGARPAPQDWTVSLVKLADKWSVTLHGPSERLRDVSLMASEDRLGDAIREAISEPPSAEGGAAESSDQALTEVREHCTCERCGQAMVVVYEAQPGEPRERVAVACPHCWSLNQVSIGSWAACGQEFRADKG